MKYIFLLICVSFGGYQLYLKLKPTVTVVAPAPTPTPTPAPAPAPAAPKAPVPQEPVQPDLTVVHIDGRSKITNCTVKSVTRDSIMFLSDQGLVQGRFVDLPPEFFAYYKPRVGGTSEQQQASEREAIREREQREYERNAQAEAKTRRQIQDQREATVYSRLDANATNRATEERLRRAASISQRISSLERQLDDDLKRSSFKGPPPMSSEMRAFLNLELDNLKSELATLR